jgi:hypothetical protein
MTVPLKRLACAAVFAAAALPAAAQDAPQYRDTLTREEAGYFFELYKDGLASMDEMEREHPSPPLPALEAGQCYTLVNTRSLSAIAGSTYEHNLSLFAPMLRDADGRVLDEDGQEFIRPATPYREEWRVIAQYPDAAGLRAAHGADALTFPNYVAVGCYADLPAMESARDALNAELGQSYIDQGFQKLFEAMQRGQGQSPAPRP